LTRVKVRSAPIGDTGSHERRDPVRGAAPEGTVNEHLRTPIREIIALHPKVGALLEAHGIGCVPCSLGSCALGDIVEIHNLSPEQERELMTAILAVVAPGEPVVLKARSAEPPRKGFSPPMKTLVEEHRLILRFIALVPAISDSLDLEREADRLLVAASVDFIRNYADRFHHAKEEDLLFARFDRESDILKVMYEDHANGRGRVRAAVEALERRDRDGVAENFAGYTAILSQHIRKEDEILYPWMDRKLSTREVGELYAAFRKADEDNRQQAARHEAFVRSLEERFATKKEEVA
jgi:hemerythrin-like domain-containing protein